MSASSEEGCPSSSMKKLGCPWPQEALWLGGWACPMVRRMSSPVLTHLLPCCTCTARATGEEKFVVTSSAACLESQLCHSLAV